MTAATAWDAERAGAHVRAWQGVPGGLLPLLHALQEEFGYIDAEAVPLIAAALNVSRAEVRGVLSFYHDFRETPPGRHVLRLCRAEACQAMGSDRLAAHVEDRLRVKLGETTADCAFTVEAVYCLGNCACAPALLLDGKLHGRVTPARADGLIAEARRRG